MLITVAFALAAATPDASFEKLVDEYYGQYSAVYPSSATELGIHDHDGDLEDMSQAAVAKESKRLRGWREKFAAVDEKPLSQMRRADLILLRASIDATLLELEDVQAWKHGPDRYPGLARNELI